jgi:hypothetical protein
MLAYLGEFLPLRGKSLSPVPPRRAGQPARLPLKQQRLFFNPTFAKRLHFPFPVLVTFAGTNPAYQ